MAFNSGRHKWMCPPAKLRLIKMYELSNTAEREVLAISSQEPPDSTTSTWIMRASTNEDLTVAMRFRLLQIEAGAESKIACSRIYVALSLPAGDFEALSYCWGDVTQLEDVTMNSTPGFSVSAHILNALQRLRRPDRPRLVWIDVICINQADVAEKSHQIALMRQIYQKARRTIIWLGVFDRAELQGPTCKRVHHAEGDEYLEDPTLCAEPGLAALEHRNVNPILRQIMQAQNNEVTRSGSGDAWWRRLWCIQEFYFSQKPPTIYIGPHAIAWTFFNQLFMFAVNVHPLTFFHDLPSHGERSLLDLIMTSRGFHCSDPRDRIYALVGMASDPQGSLTPDYGKSVTEIYEEATVHMVKACRTLDILLDGRVDRLSGPLPSGIPELTSLQSLQKTRGPDEYRAGIALLPEVELVVDNRERSSAPIQSPTEFSAPRFLKLKARYLDRIVARTTHEHFELQYRECCNRYAREISRDHNNFSPDRVVAMEPLLCLKSILDALVPKPYVDRRPVFPPGRAPALGFLTLEYLFDGKRSVVEEFEKHSPRSPTIQPRPLSNLSWNDRDWTLIIETYGWSVLKENPVDCEIGVAFSHILLYARASTLPNYFDLNSWNISLSRSKCHKAQTGSWR